MANITFGQAVGEGIAITLYGDPVTDLSMTGDQARSMGILGGGAAPRFARIKAFRVGSLRCVRLPVPALLLVLDNGQELKEDECGFAPGAVTKWMLPPHLETIALESSQGPVGDLLEEIANKGVSGGVRIENPRFEGGKICADIHIWAKIEVFARSVRFDERIPVCISVGQPCFTVWEIGWANLQICFRAPNQVCAKLCVGKWGLERCWEHCESVSLPLAAAPHHGGCCAAE